MKKLTSYIQRRFLGNAAGNIDWTARNIYNIETNLKYMSLQEILGDAKYDDPKRLTRHGYKFYSQNYEDGIIKEIFNRIGTTNKTFVEFGVEDGIENNTLALLFEEWSGLWIECDDDAYNRLIKGFERTIKAGRLKVEKAFITVNNINDLIGKNIKNKEIDLLCIDIDGNDFHIYDAINVINPRVIIFEYNAKFPAHIEYCMEYKEDYGWDGTDNFGVSLKYLETRLDKKGYALVGCGIAGFNTFFVRKDLVGDKFLAPYTAENHYEPAKYWLGKPANGHRASSKPLEHLFLP